MTVPSLKTRIGTQEFETCVWNAAGPHCTTFEELDTLLECSATGGVVTKSCTLKERKGNPHPRVFRAGAKEDAYSINSVGLANEGICSYLEWIASRKPEKPVFLSIGGLSWEENETLLTLIERAEVLPQCLELNLSCPNLVSGVHPLQPQSIVGYNYEEMRRHLSLFTLRVFSIRRSGKKIQCGVKLPPYFDALEFICISELLNRFHIDLNYVATINGVPNGLVIDTETETPKIKPKGGLGGVGGRLVKPVGLANVAQLREYLHPDIQIIGCGGISTGEDAFQYILAGADAVSVATQFLQEGIGCFERITKELVEILERKNVVQLSDFRGKLKR